MRIFSIILVTFCISFTCLSCTSPTRSSLDEWQRHVIDAEKPWRAVFIDAADLDGDGHKDIVTGGWWYKNPGSSGGEWTRRDLGLPLRNMAAVYDFDGDGDADVLGTEGEDAESSADFVLAINDGAGEFTILPNIAQAKGDFLQGVAVGRFRPNGPIEVFLSWHQPGNGVQALTVPENPSKAKWAWRTISDTSQDEQLSVGDIDRDGDADLLLGTQWLQNDDGNWNLHTIHEPLGKPDRNRLADINGDGRLDSLVGYESSGSPGILAWYEQGANAAEPWTENIIANLIGPMSMDAADLDGDGDVDVSLGQHNLKDPSGSKQLVFENVDGAGKQWTEHVVSVGDEHHDGSIVTDLDGDGDLDIISIGWTHPRVLFFENKSANGR